MYTSKYLADVGLFVLIFGGAVLLQVFLSKKGNKWLGLILPIMNIMFSLIPALWWFNIVIFLPRAYEKFDESGNLLERSTIIPSAGAIGQVIFMASMTFVIYNISTLVFMAVYWICRKRQAKHINE